MAEPRRAEHFATRAHQEAAAELGMWTFLSSETLLFAGLFGLYASYRAAYPAAFRAGMAHMAHGLGALNTFVLLTSSLSAAVSVSALRAGLRRLSLGLLAVTAALGVAFLAVKGVEYADHFREGMVPGGRTGFFLENAVGGLPIFVTLYFLMTGLHALHVTGGVALLCVMGVRVARSGITPEVPYPLELAVLYWHLVDVIWVFLWPMFYFGRGLA